MTRVWLCVLFVTACRGGETEQTVAEAANVLCGGKAIPDWTQLPPSQRALELRRWLTAHITNREVRAFIATLSSSAPWDAGSQIKELATEAGVADCHPISALAGIRGPNGVDVPELQTSDGTADPLRAPIVAVTTQQLAVEGQGRFPLQPASDDVMRALRATKHDGVVMLAVERVLPMRDVLPVLDALLAASVQEARLLVTSGAELRTVSIELRPGGGDNAPIVAAVSIATTATILNGKPVMRDRLAGEIRALRATQVAVRCDANVTVQTLAEVAAAANGRISLGAATSPEPITRSGRSP